MSAIKVTWTQLKAIATSKPNLSIQVYDLDDHYFTFVIDGSFTIQTTLSKTSPSQAVDVLDLENNFITPGLVNGQVDTKQIRGGSDLTLIGNIGDRLKVETSVPSFTTLYQPQFVSEVTNLDDMAQDGSLTPLDYFLTVPAGETWYLTSLDVLLIDKGSLDPKDFGAIDDGLASGLEVSITVSAVKHIMYNFMNNMDLTLFFNSISNNDGADGEDGWLDSKDKFIGKKDFFPFQILKGGDSINCIVQDDLTKLKYFKIMVHKFKGL